MELEPTQGSARLVFVKRKASGKVELKDRGRVFIAVLRLGARSPDVWFLDLVL